MDHAALVAGEAAPDRVEQPAVDLEDDLQVARQQRLEPRERPFFERLGQQRMVRVRERPLGEVPGLIPSEMRLVEQDPHELGDRHGRVRIVKLHGNLLGKRAPVGVGASESSNQVGQRAGDEKVLLHEAQPLPLGRGVVGIEHPSERFGLERLRHRADELTVAERLEIEVVGRGRRPQPERVDRLAAIAHHGPIERKADQRRRPADDGPQRSLPDLERAVELDLDPVVRTSDLPRVGATKPVVGLLVLPTVFDGLPEDPVLVPEPVSDRRELHRSHRVEKARGQTPEPTIAQPGVGFLFEQAEPIERRLLDRFAHEGTEQQVRDVIGQRATDQKLHREVVDALGVRALVGLLRADPSLRENVPDGARERLVALTRTGGGRIGNVVEEQVPLIERMGGTREIDRAASILLAQRRRRVRCGFCVRNHLFCAHRRAFSRCPRTWAGPMLSALGVWFQRRIAGSDRSCSCPTALRLAVPNRKYLPATGSRPSQRAANTRRKCPLEKSSTSPPMARTRRITRSARAPTSPGDSPPGQPSRNNCQSGRPAWMSALVRPSYVP